MSARAAERRGVGIPFAPRLGSQTPHQGKTPGVHLHCPPRLAGGLGGGLAVGTYPPIGSGGAPSQGGYSSPAQTLAAGAGTWFTLWVYSTFSVHPTN